MFPGARYMSEGLVSLFNIKGASRLFWLSPSVFSPESAKQYQPALSPDPAL
jgi:hypothetical protein